MVQKFYYQEGKNLRSSWASGLLQNFAMVGSLESTIQMSL